MALQPLTDKAILLESKTFSEMTETCSKSAAHGEASGLCSAAPGTT